MQLGSTRPSLPEVTLFPLIGLRGRNHRFLRCTLTRCFSPLHPSLRIESWYYIILKRDHLVKGDVLYGKKICTSSVL